MDEQRRLREDLAATVEARRELGREYEVELIDSFVERLDRTIAERVDATVNKRRAGDSEDSGAFWLALSSLGLGIPLTAISGSLADTAGILLTWAGIAGVNAAHAWGRRRRPHDR